MDSRADCLFSPGISRVEGSHIQGIRATDVVASPFKVVNITIPKGSK